jgi:hypothetical protein
VVAGRSEHVGVSVPVVTLPLGGGLRDVEREVALYRLFVFFSLADQSFVLRLQLYLKN